MRISGTEPSSVILSQTIAVNAGVIHTRGNFIGLRFLTNHLATGFTMKMRVLYPGMKFRGL